MSIERGFASRPIEGASGLVYMRARHYDPTTGRFLQPDPEGIASTQRYAFAEHNPYIYNDPTGRSSRGISGDLNRGVPPSSFEKGGLLANNFGGPFMLNDGPMLEIQTMLTAMRSANVAQRGEWLYPAGGSRDINDYRLVLLNGVGVTRAEFQQRITDRDDAAGFYNPTNGRARDVLEAFWQKFDGKNDPYARQFSEGLANVDHPMRIIAHSQGTLTVANAAQYHGLPAGSHIEFISPAISTWRAEAAANAAGATHNYNLPYGDGAALWAPSLNPIKFRLGIIDMMLGFPVHTSTDP